MRRRSGTNPGETAGTTGAVNGGQADGGGSGLLAGGTAASDGPGVPAPAGQNVGGQLTLERTLPGTTTDVETLRLVFFDTD